MSLHRRIDGGDPQSLPNVPGPLEIRRETRRGVVGIGTLACPDCDAPVDPGAGPIAPAAPLACPFCGRDGAVRDFLSLKAPARPARVVIRVVHRAPMVERASE